MMTTERFRDLIASITKEIEGCPIDNALEADLNGKYPPTSPTFLKIVAACQDAVTAGWMCEREAGGIKYGRVIKPGPETHGFSVDVVEMENVKGPHHRHPNCEIDMIMPIDGDAQFDSRGAGWLVYGPNSAHSPTVSKGKALVLYLLPGGAIEFTK